MRRKLFGKLTWLIIFVTAQLVLIVYLSIQIRQRHSVAGNSSVSNLKKESLSSAASGSLKFFYEFRPESTEIADPPEWLSSTPKYQINTDGINSSINYTPEKAPDTFRIMSIGDSFTFGLFVDTKDSYPSVLERLLNDGRCSSRHYEVINLGVPGYDIRYATERFKVRGQKYQPDIILWFLGGVDFFKYNEFLRERGGYYLSQSFGKGMTKLTAADQAQSAQKASEDLKKEFSEDDLMNYQLSSFKSLRQNFSGKIVIFSWPSFTDERFSKLMKEFLSLPGENRFYNVSDIYKLEEKFPDGHPTARGYRIMSDDLAQYLVREAVIPCARSL